MTDINVLQVAVSIGGTFSTPLQTHAVLQLLIYSGDGLDAKQLLQNAAANFQIEITDNVQVLVHVWMCYTGSIGQGCAAMIGKQAIHVMHISSYM